MLRRGSPHDVIEHENTKTCHRHSEMARRYTRPSFPLTVTVNLQVVRSRSVDIVAGILNDLRHRFTATFSERKAVKDT